VVAEGFTGTYDYTVLAAQDVGALHDWLAQHGFGEPDAGDLDHYVSAGWAFVALTLHASAPAAEETALPPIELDYPGDAVAFPAVMARHATLPTQRTTVYVVGDATATVAEGWSSVDEPVIAGGDDPDDRWTSELTGLGSARSYLRTWSGPFDGRQATRFDTLAPREVHDADVVFGFADRAESLSTTIDVSGGAGQAALVLPLVALGAWIRRRPG
jgi:hypothetical protein